MSDVRVLNCDDSGPGGHWLDGIYNRTPTITWEHVSTWRGPLLRRLPVRPHPGRVRAGLVTRARLARKRIDLVVSHGPRTSYYLEQLANPTPPHLAWSFNFTDLPSGYQLNAMRRVFARIERFIVFSRFECARYAQLFDIPVERFQFIHWGVNPPIDQPEPRVIAAPYVAALGGEARDYATLCEAAQLLPQVRFVAVVRPHNLVGLRIPDNLTIFTNLPFAQAWSIVWHAAMAVVPLRSAETPNGHVTLVGGMHLGKAQIVTDSAGVRDYLQQEENALLVPPQDPGAIARAIERLIDEPALAERMGAAAQMFAHSHCSEQATIDAFREQLLDLVPTAQS